MGFAYFIFNIILFQKNIHLLLLYLKHVIKLSGYNLGYYREGESCYDIFEISSCFDRCHTWGISLIRQDYQEFVYLCIQSL